MKQNAPDVFTIEFGLDDQDSSSFRAHCERARAPLHADRIWNLARHGYYSDNYVFRILPNFVAQFGTSGDSSVSNVYNYTSTNNADCAILQPQPPFMPYCLKSALEGDDVDDDEKTMTGTVGWISRTIAATHQRQSILPWTKTRRTTTASSRMTSNNNCTNSTALSNTFGTLAMSTGYNRNLPEFPQGVTWNATAELFINLGDNSQRLDRHLFIPICTIDEHNMDVVVKFPSFGEVAELGGTGPSLGQLYEQGNSYIEARQEWSSMAKVERVTVCDAS